MIVRNSQENSTWGREERDGPQPFKPGDSGEIHIVCLKDKYKVWLSGRRHLPAIMLWDHVIGQFGWSTVDMYH